MNRVTLLETARIPGDGGELGLYQHGEDFVIKLVGGQDLMSTRTHGSADALADLTCPEVAERERPRVLIGGMGMGFTLAAALRHLGPDAEVVVATDRESADQSAAKILSVLRLLEYIPAGGAPTSPPEEEAQALSRLRTLGYLQ